MPTTGGLKLALQAATRDDRRLRFAQVKLRTAGIEDEFSLVTDARGRMRYRLPDGFVAMRKSPHVAKSKSSLVAS